MNQWLRATVQAMSPIGVVAGIGLTALPLALGTFYVDIGILAALYVALAVAFDLVAGRIGALSLAQTLFLGVGAYSAALLSVGLAPGGWAEFAIAAVLGAAVALAIGIPSFRLSLHSFAIGTLGFAIIGRLVATNWIEVTGGPLCTKNIPPLTLWTPSGVIVAETLESLYLVVVAIAWMTVGIVWGISRSSLGLTYTAVRDDPVLADARGLWPNRLRISAFMISGAVTAVGGVFLAHYIGVVCPAQFEILVTQMLLIMVFVGGRASLRGVVSAAVLFTVLPQVLRMADRWRMVLLSAVLLFVVLYAPSGLEVVWQRLERAGRRAGHYLGQLLRLGR